MIIKSKKHQEYFPKMENIKPNSIGLEEFDVNSVEVFIKHKSKQFITSKGFIFARIDVEINHPISLSYHYKKTKSFDEFIESINSFMSAEQKLDSIDINKLKNMYENHEKVRMGGTPVSQELVNFLINKEDANT